MKEGKNMFCSKCGNQVSDGARFCSKCGNPMSIPAPVVAPPVQPTYAPVEPVAPAQPVYTPPVATPALDDDDATVVMPVAPVVESEPEEEKTMIFMPDKKAKEVEPVEPTPVVEPMSEIFSYSEPIAPAEPMSEIFSYSEPITPAEPMSEIFSYSEPVNDSEETVFAPVEPVYTPNEPVYTPNKVAYAPVEPSFVSFESKYPSNEPAPAPAPKKKGNKGLIIAIVAVILAIAIGVGVIIGINASDNDGKKKEDTEETTKDKKEETTEPTTEEPEVEPVKYFYKNTEINGQTYAIAVDENGRVIFDKECAVYYTLDEQGNVALYENGTPVKHLLNQEITGGRFTSIVLEDTLYLEYLSCEMPAGWEYDADFNAVYAMDTDFTPVIAVGFPAFYAMSDNATLNDYYNVFAKDMPYIEKTENVTLPGTNYKAIKGEGVVADNGEVLQFVYFYVFETPTGIYCVDCGINTSQIDSGFDFDKFIRQNITVY